MQLVPIMLTKQSTSATASQNHGLLIFFFIFSPILFLKNNLHIRPGEGGGEGSVPAFQEFCAGALRHFGEEDAASLTILLYVRSVLPVAHGKSREIRRAKRGRLYAGRAQDLGAKYVALKLHQKVVR